MIKRALRQTYPLFGMMTTEVGSDGLKLRRDELPIAFICPALLFLLARPLARRVFLGTLASSKYWRATVDEDGHYSFAVAL